jgi:hypothetical protein
VLAQGARCSPAEIAAMARASGLFTKGRPV